MPPDHLIYATFSYVSISDTDPRRDEGWLSANPRFMDMLKMRLGNNDAEYNNKEIFLKLCCDRPELVFILQNKDCLAIYVDNELMVLATLLSVQCKKSLHGQIHIPHEVDLGQQ